MTDLGNRERAESGFSAPAAFVNLAREVILHRSDDRFSLLYRLLWRMQGERHVLEMKADADVAHALEALAVL